MAHVHFKDKTGKVVDFNTKGNKKSRSIKAPRRSKLRIPSKSRAKIRTAPRRHKTMAKNRRRRSHSGSSSGGVMNLLLAGAAAGFIGSMVPYGNIGKIGVAVVAGKQGGLLGSTAKALGTIGAAGFVQGAGITPATVTSGGGGSW